MREYTEKRSIRIFKNTFVKVLVSVFGSAILFVALTMMSSLLIRNTNIPENAETLVMIIITALTAVILSTIVTLILNTKGILCSVYVSAIIILAKIILSLLINGSIGMGRQGIIGIVFVFVFCLVGGVLGSNMKK